jgi:hypothetical protein
VAEKQTQIALSDLDYKKEKIEGKNNAFLINISTERKTRKF